MTERIGDPKPIPIVYDQISVPDRRPYISEVAFKSEWPDIAIKSTAAFLDKYFNEWESDDVHSSSPDVILAHSIHFLDDVQRGNFFARFIKKPIKGRDLQKVFENETGIIISPFMWEAYRRARIIFNEMPHEIAPSHLLAPPVDEDDFVKRVAELQIELDKIVTGETSPHIPINHTQSLFRTFAFFKTGEVLAS